MVSPPNSVGAAARPNKLAYRYPHSSLICASNITESVPVVPARGGAEVALGVYYKTFLIHRTCMRRAPARPVRACILRKWCPVSSVASEAPLHTSDWALHTPHFTLHTPHFTLHTALFPLHTSLHTALLRLHTSHSTLHTSHFTLHTSHFSLLSSHSTLHTSHFTLHTALFTPQTSHFTLHTSSHLSSSHLYPSSSLLISLLICHLSFHKSLPGTASYYKTCTKYLPTTLYYKACTK